MKKKKRRKKKQHQRKPRHMPSYSRKQVRAWLNKHGIEGDRDLLEHSTYIKGVMDFNGAFPTVDMLLDSRKKMEDCPLDQNDFFVNMMMNLEYQAIDALIKYVTENGDKLTYVTLA